MREGATIAASLGEPRTLRLRCHAKINLFLDVLGRRPDGYHELDTVFQTIGLHDTLELELGATASRKLTIEVSGEPVPADASNLAWRAADAYSERWWPKLSLEIRLHKRIPAGAGLGGGSSNCAAVLLGLRRLLGRPKNKAELLEVASNLGADVPFFLFGGSARGRGRGDRIEPLADLEPCDLLLGLSHESVSTARVFRSLNAGEISGAAQGRTLPSSPLAHKWVLGNDLQPLVLELFPRVKNVYNALQEIGSSSVQLSGSGGAVFALVKSADYDLDCLNRRLEGDGRLLLSHTVPAKVATAEEAGA